MYNGAEKRMGKGRFCREFAVKTNKIMDLNTVKTVVVKIGTSTLTYENGKMNLRRIDKLCRTLCDLQNGGRRIVLVTSGAIGQARIAGAPGRHRQKAGACRHRPVRADVCLR